MKLDSRPQHGQFTVAQRAADTPILLHLESGYYYTLNEVGGRVWELCDGVRRVEDIIAVLCGEYDASTETVTADVLELLETLANEQLVASSE